HASSPSRSRTAPWRWTDDRSTPPRTCGSASSPRRTVSDMANSGRRAVITGLGVISCIGNSREAVLDSLRAGRSGIRFNEKFREMGLRSQVSGSIDLDVSEHIDRKARRFMGDAAAFAYVAMRDAIADSGLEPGEISHPRTGLI